MTLKRGFWKSGAHGKWVILIALMLCGWFAQNSFAQTIFPPLVGEDVAIQRVQAELPLIELAFEQTQINSEKDHLAQKLQMATFLHEHLVGQSSTSEEALRATLAEFSAEVYTNNANDRDEPIIYGRSNGSDNEAFDQLVALLED